MTNAIQGRLAILLLSLMLGMAPLTLSAQDVAPIDINTADAELLTELPGVGPSRAEAIIEERETNGPFESAEDLTRVSGIGEATVAKLQDQVTF